MSTFIEGFAKGYGDARERSLKREIFLGEQKDKKSRALAASLPRLLEARSTVEQLGVKMDYLESRGLDERTLGVIYSDPEALGEAYEILRTEGADWDAETTTSYIRAASSGKDPVTPWRQQFEQTMSVFKDLNVEELNPETIPQIVQSVTPSPTGVVEIRPRPKAGEGDVSEAMKRRWGEQEILFDNQIVELAQTRLNDLEVKQARDEITDSEARELAILGRDLQNYSTQPNAKLQLRRTFEPVVFEALSNNPNVQPEVLVGLEQNPRLYRLGQGDQKELADPVAPENVPQVKSREEWEALPSGTEYIDPEGVRRIKG